MERVGPTGGDYRRNSFACCDSASRARLRDEGQGLGQTRNALSSQRYISHIPNIRLFFVLQVLKSPSQRTGYRTALSIKAANDQLQHFCDLLEGEGCVVKRPEEVDFGVSVKTPDW